MMNNNIPHYGIDAFTPEKRKLRSLLKMFSMFISKNKKRSIHESVKHSGKPPVQVLYNILDKMSDNISDHTRMSGRIPDTRYRDIITEFFEFGLYVYYNDTAFMDIGDYILLQLYQPENAEVILDYLSKYKPDIKECYYNKWERFKQKTITMEQEGTRQRGELCDEEMLLVNDAIKKKVDKFGKQNKN